MFFELHDEKRIAYKHLTKPDLGLSPTSHLTHIGLFGDVFTYLPNKIEIDDCMLIYENSIELLPLYFGRIENPDGTHRSPKIRKGEKNVVSIVTFIRDRALEFNENIDWYLFWFGLKSGQPVFFLFNNSSDTYKEVCSLGIELRPQIKNKLAENNTSFKKLLNYLEGIINRASIEIVEELEVVVQTTPIPAKNYRPYDLEKARKIYSEIGKEGEILIEKYFSNLKKLGEIINYRWSNEKAESGLPFDFYYETQNGEIIFLEVKTTNYKFAQKMIFSNQEIDFAVSTNNKYYIYRVYTSEEGKRCFKVCKNAKELFLDIHNRTSAYEENLQPLASLETIKMAIIPTQEKLQFSNPTILTP